MNNYTKTNIMAKTSRRWNKEYKSGRYNNEPPVNFVKKITDVLEKNPHHSKGVGLYVGCGNGRNYIPLADLGLNIIGIDISNVAIDELIKKNSTYSDKLSCQDFENFHSEKLFDYIIAIQVFQHGTQKEISKYFEKASSLLKSGGLLFLRVNSVSTDIYFKHITTETNNHGGITIRYVEGPKKDLDIHFYSREELDVLCTDFDYITPPYEDMTKRDSPKTGTWSQWELILQKK